MKHCKRLCRDLPRKTKQDMGLGACYCRRCRKYMPTPGNRRCKCCDGFVRTRTTRGHRTAKQDMIPYKAARLRVIA